MKILFLGAPGSGKSTQGQLLAKDYKFEWLSSGQLFRESNDPKIQKIMKGAQLVPDEITEEMMLGAMNGKEKVILDGFPRNLAQCEFLEAKGIEIDLIIEIVAPEDELVKRMLLRGRSQDSEDVAKERIEIYKRSRDAVIGFYEKRGNKIVEIDGVGEIEKIQERVKEAINHELIEGELLEELTEQEKEESIDFEEEKSYGE